MKNLKLKGLLKAKSLEEKVPDEDISFLNQNELNQIGGGYCTGENSCGYFGANQKCGPNSCSWNA